MPRFRTPQQPPIVPNYVNYVYVGAHLLSQYFSYAEHHILHGFFSVLPIFMILYILKNRLRKGGDLGSVMITLSFLAESFGIFQFCIRKLTCFINSHMQKGFLIFTLLSIFVVAYFISLGMLYTLSNLHKKKIVNTQIHKNLEE